MLKQSTKLAKSKEALKYYYDGKDLALRGRYEEAIELKGNNLDILNAKMISAFQLGRLEEAIEAYYNQAMCLLYLGRYEEAI